MKNLFKTFINMVYPALISLFLFIFTTAFVSGEYLEILQVLTVISSILFGILFLSGIIGNSILLIKNKEK